MSKQTAPCILSDVPKGIMIMSALLLYCTLLRCFHWSSFCNLSAPTQGFRDDRLQDQKITTVPLAPDTSPEWFHADGFPHVVVFVGGFLTLSPEQLPLVSILFVCVCTQPQCPDNSPEGSCVSSTDCCPGEVSTLKADGGPIPQQCSPIPLMHASNREISTKLRY